MAIPRVSIARGRSRELEDITPTTKAPVPDEAANVFEAYRLLAAGGDTGLASLADAAARHDLLARVEERASVAQPL
jgi:hypothetical protein